MNTSRTLPTHLLLTSIIIFLLVHAHAYAQSAPATIGNSSELPTIAVVSTGGTIAEKTDPKTGGAVPTVSGADLVDAVPQLTNIANISVHSYTNIDSSQMSPVIWAGLSRKVAQLVARDDIDGVVITHGTDTMAIGSYFLDLTLDTKKPVVFTGAMNDASSPFPDGPGNLMNAVILAASPAAREWGVTVALNRYVNSARDVRKTQTTNVQTFKSGEKGYLGYIIGNDVHTFNTRTDRITLPLPKTLPKVVYIATYPGADGSFVRAAVDAGAKGIVVDGVGAGNVNAATYDAIKYALSKDVAIAIASQVYHGAVEPIYGDAGGGRTLAQHGCILAGDLTGQKARILLMLGLAKYGNKTELLQPLFTP